MSQNCYLNLIPKQRVTIRTYVCCTATRPNALWIIFKTKLWEAKEFSLVKFSGKLFEYSNFFQQIK